MRAVMSDATGDAGASYQPPHPPPHTACAASEHMIGDTPRAAASTLETSCAAVEPARSGVLTCDPAQPPSSTRVATAVSPDAPASDARGDPGAKAMNTPASAIPVVRCIVPPSAWRASLLKFQHFRVEETGVPATNR
jgi:hypothetical protein